jgi:hypothetical protein
MGNAAPAGISIRAVSRAPSKACRGGVRGYVHSCSQKASDVVIRDRSNGHFAEFFIVKMR